MRAPLVVISLFGPRVHFQLTIFSEILPIILVFFTSVSFNSPIAPRVPSIICVDSSHRSEPFLNFFFLKLHFKFLGGLAAETRLTAHLQIWGALEGHGFQT